MEATHKLSLTVNRVGWLASYGGPMERRDGA
jgi:hypothetical protein